MKTRSDFQKSFFLRHPSVGRRAFNARDRQRWDEREKEGDRVFVEVGPHLYRWGRWRHPLSLTFEEWIEQQVGQGFKVVFVE